jgi:hypothetical protein
MTTFIFANNVNTALAGAVSTTATTITLASSANLPSSIPSGFALAITLNDQATRNNYEIVYATAITISGSSATLTVQRAQEGTTALAWLVGDFVFSGPTAGQQASFAELSGNNTWTGNNTFNNPVVVPNAATSNEAINLGQAEADFAALNGSSSETFNVAQAVSPTQAMPLGQLPSQFPSSLSANGFKKYPDSNSPTGFFIEQWGNGLFPTQITTNGLNFPIAFPNAVLNFTCSLGNAINLTVFTCCGGQATSTTQFSISVAAPSGGSDTVWWTAKGY